MIIGSEIIFLENVTSTNSHAVSLLSRERPQEGTILYTGHQSAGRGQPGSKWESEPGKNLLFSVILYPSIVKPEDQFVISMALSLGMTDFISSITPDCRVKWPNDIYIKDDKIAGILIESTILGPRIEYLVAGIGLNVNQLKFPENLPNPVSLKMITGKEYDPEECLKELATCLDRRYSFIRTGASGRIKQDYISKLYRYGQWCAFRNSSGIFEGRITDVRNDGEMIIEKRSGEQSGFYFKEVEFIS